MPKNLRGLNVLITSGPTSVPIDDIRVITNRSTGEMGRLLARACVRAGARVTLLEGAVTTTVPVAGVTVKKFYFYDELDRLLCCELAKPYDIVIHAAAVADFALKKPFKGKRRSSDKLTLKLVPTRKLINLIKNMRPTPTLVGFKLETKLTPRRAQESVRPLLNEAGCDFVVANSQRGGSYRACLVNADGRLSPFVDSKSALVRLLIRCFSVSLRSEATKGRQQKSNSKPRNQ